ncbi:DNA helicase-2/ATP-dependent DNA helicase PcrA [Clostridium tetanomorphum]|uniref:DNA 3'-5' helicase n=1 Tax=Clostridium tetanomorphum TaxID=1553 RepID=A0A923E9Y5_CLOTT|nr:ATP-dependent helicase [Clostridium tetanomorphum]KAJ51612.1 Superfamily I DNA helicase (rep-like helicase) [Clostridium tetanomorphum DSM 665]MBC2396513.1 ATP-dependent helicase [Clostridium tetanomorphum]MBP1863837.1 DNA helicase-2/ATP-dependent DNA helicase PcrA [Clostridium tetanomorphum]NRS84915.1 DNA helicase-2/ATP-dependent DNA helicase PcrA [Clostridium tetanomorphum]NRZ98131.1 DNA helicase-2/ATP-dependent DNA helicase PcrA [Clostridium tetanomorphum]
MIEETLKREFCYLRDKIIEKRYQHLDEMQRKAVFNNSNNCVIIACPGSGKTTVIINRLDYLCTFGPVYNTDYVPNSLKLEDLKYMREYLNNDIEEKTCVIPNRVIYLINKEKIKPENIVILSFTKTASQNMKDRYINNIKNKSLPFFGTFHSLCYSILNKNFKKINMINDNEKYDLVEEFLKDYTNNLNQEKIKEVINDISLFKSNNIEINRFVSKLDKKVFYNCYLEYESYKENYNLLDFDDLQLKCKELLQKNKKVLHEYRDRFKYILVDEFQDCDNMQIEILKLLNKNNSIFAVGDEDQCIYGFRGSKPECMVNFHNYFLNGNKVFLFNNYRSGKHIVNISEKLIRNNCCRNNKKMKAYNKFSGEVNLKFTKDEKEQVNKICDEIKYLVHSKNYSYEDFSIIYRRNIESVILIDKFLKNNIPFKLLQKQFTLYEHFIFKDIIAYLKLSLNRKDKDSLIRIINRPFRYISRTIINKLYDSTIKDNCFDLLYNEDISSMNIKAIKQLEKSLNRLLKLPFEKIIDYILNSIGYINYIEYYNKKLNMDEDELFYIVNEIEESIKDFTSIRDFIEYVELTNNKSIFQQEGVTLSTIHGVKGMEFKNVFIINCNDGNIPYIKDENFNLEEERRLFYVGITRAIEKIYFFIPKSNRKTYLIPSRFIKECGLTYKINYEDYKKGDEVVHFYFGKGIIDNIKKDKISVVFHNNIIRNFCIDKIQFNNLFNNK